MPSHENVMCNISKAQGLQPLCALLIGITIELNIHRVVKSNKDPQHSGILKESLSLKVQTADIQILTVSW